MLLIAARCDCRVHFLYCFFIQRILCTKKNRPCGSQDSRKYQYAEDNSCIDTLRLGNRAGCMGAAGLVLDKMQGR